jgi:hypothetical protein
VQRKGMRLIRRLTRTTRERSEFCGAQAMKAVSDAQNLHAHSQPAVAAIALLLKRLATCQENARRVDFAMCNHFRIMQDSPHMASHSVVAMSLALQLYRIGLASLTLPMVRPPTHPPRARAPARLSTAL